MKEHIGNAIDRMGDRGDRILYNIENHSFVIIIILVICVSGMFPMALVREHIYNKYAKHLLFVLVLPFTVMGIGGMIIIMPIIGLYMEIDRYILSKTHPYTIDADKLSFNDDELRKMETNSIWRFTRTKIPDGSDIGLLHFKEEKLKTWFIMNYDIISQ